MASSNKLFLKLGFKIKFDSKGCEFYERGNSLGVDQVILTDIGILAQVLIEGVRTPLELTLELIEAINTRLAEQDRYKTVLPF